MTAHPTTETTAATAPEIAPWKVDALFDYCQERCLWQFFSRSWDREENIDGILAAAIELLNGDEPRKNTPMSKLFYADAKIMVSDFKSRFPWIAGCGPEEIRGLIAGLKERLTEIAVTKSLNKELNNSLY
jgi:vanadium nitrogenase delta subunit